MKEEGRREERMKGVIIVFAKYSSDIQRIPFILFSFPPSSFKTITHLFPINPWT